VSTFERILAGAAGGNAAIAIDRKARAQGSSFGLKRAARRAVSATLGVARRALRPNHEELPPTVGVEVRLAAVAGTEAPVVAAVVVVTGDLIEVEVPTALARQTDVDLEVALWNPNLGRAVVHGGGALKKEIEAPDRETLAAGLAATHIVELVVSDQRLAPTLVEICRWTIASEGLPLIVTRTAAGRGARTILGVEEKAGWIARSSAGLVGEGSNLTKIVGGSGALASGVGAGPLVWSESGVGGGYLMTPGSATVVHEVASIEGVVAATDPDDDRPPVLLVTSLQDGAQEPVIWLLGGLRDSFRFTVVVTGPDSGGDRRLGAVTEFAEAVYPIADFLDPLVWPSVVADLIRARKIGTVLRVGGILDLPDEEIQRPRVIDLPLDPTQLGAGSDVVLALGSVIADAAAGTDAVVVPMVVSTAAPAQLPDTERANSIRTTFSIPDDARLVVSFADLVPDQRPEDVAAVAHRLRHLGGVHFLLVGEGELAGTVSDVARYFGLENFTVAPRTHDLVDLILAADAVMLTAERDPWSVAAVLALTLGRPMVATDVVGRRELVEAVSSERVSLVPAGDIAGLATAVAAVLDDKKKPRATKKAWRAAEVRNRESLDLVRGALQGELTESNREG